MKLKSFLRGLTSGAFLATGLATCFPVSAQPASAPTAGNVPEPIILMVPIEVSSKALSLGCWAQLYDERNFKGEMTTLVGPAQVQTVDKGTGRYLKRSINSLVLGPKAKLTVYEHQLFRDKSVEFAANAREGGLIKKLGFGGRIESLKLQCD